MQSLNLYFLQRLNARVAKYKVIGYSNSKFHYFRTWGEIWKNDIFDIYVYNRINRK